MNTNRLGDMLLELRDPQLDHGRQEEIRRLLNEIGDREEKYKSWLKTRGANPQFEYPVVRDVRWLGSPLSTSIAQRIADVTVTTATNTYITFDTSKRFGTAFSVSDDGTKIFWDGLDGKAFNISGYVIWAQNGTGYRAAYLEGFDSNDVSLGTAPLHTAAGQNLVDNVLPISFTFYFNGFSYLKFFVFQSSGGDLTMKEFTLGISLA